MSKNGVNKTWSRDTLTGPWNPQPTSSPGNPLFFDDFGYTLNRVDTFATKLAAVQAAGWSYMKDNNLSDGAKGYLYTASSIPGYSGTIPGSSGRVLVVEREAEDGDGNGDLWLGYGDYADAATEAEAAIPSTLWLQYWQRTDPGTPAPNGKLWYPIPAYPGTRTGYPGSADEMPWFMTMGTSTLDPDGSSGTSPSFADGYTYRLEANRSDRTSWPAYNQWKLGPNLVSGDAMFMHPGTFYLHKMYFNTSGPTGRWEWWKRALGVMEWTKMAEFIPGVTPNFTWNTIPQERNGFRYMKWPVTSTPANTFQITDICWAAAEADLPVYGSY